MALLEEARGRDVTNPQLALNLGLAHQRVGRYSDAGSLLSSVLGRIPPAFVAVTAANAAFSYARSGWPERAVALLSIVYSRVTSVSSLPAGGAAVTVAFDDLPGIATWVDEEAIWQSGPDEASSIIDRLVAMIGGTKAVPERVADLAEFYQAASTA
jgi:hypothetical protein